MYRNFSEPLKSNDESAVSAFHRQSEIDLITRMMQSSPQSLFKLRNWNKLEQRGLRLRINGRFMTPTFSYDFTLLQIQLEMSNFSTLFR